MSSVTPENSVMPWAAEVSKLMHRLSFSCDYIVYFSNAFKEIVLIVLAALSMSYLFSCCFMVIDLATSRLDVCYLRLGMKAVGTQLASPMFYRILYLVCFYKGFFWVNSVGV